ncbi:MAG: hypothetical protein IPK17_13785 [Chloroflexi bacterium]|nr:hypothetical protein [Chloroflexota bacterium]
MTAPCVMTKPGCGKITGRSNSATGKFVSTEGSRGKASLGTSPGAYGFTPSRVTLTSCPMYSVRSVPNVSKLCWPDSAMKRVRVGSVTVITVPFSSIDTPLTTMRAAEPIWLCSTSVLSGAVPQPFSLTVVSSCSEVHAGKSGGEASRSDTSPSMSIV